MSENLNNRIIDFFTDHTSDDAPECILLNAVQGLMPSIIKPRILDIKKDEITSGSLNPDDVRKLIKEILSEMDLYLTEALKRIEIVTLDEGWAE